jgi:hypothetical protein
MYLDGWNVVLAQFEMRVVTLVGKVHDRRRDGGVKQSQWVADFVNGHVKQICSYIDGPMAIKCQIPNIIWEQYHLVMVDLLANRWSTWRTRGNEPRLHEEVRTREPKRDCPGRFRCKNIRAPSVRNFRIQQLNWIKSDVIVLKCIPDDDVGLARRDLCKSQNTGILPQLESSGNFVIHLAAAQFGRVSFDVISQVLFRPTVSIWIAFLKKLGLYTVNLKWIYLQQKNASGEW